MLTFYLLLVKLNQIGSGTSLARKDVGDYWKTVMDGQPIPDSIKDLFQDDQDLPINPSDQGINGQMMKRDRFVEDFDDRQSAIIYHSGHDSKKP